jgi:hypothetical protein
MEDTGGSLWIQWKIDYETDVDFSSRAAYSGAHSGADDLAD